MIFKYLPVPTTTTISLHLQRSDLLMNFLSYCTSESQHLRVWSPGCLVARPRSGLGTEGTGSRLHRVPEKEAEERQLRYLCLDWVSCNEKKFSWLMVQKCKVQGSGWGGLDNWTLGWCRYQTVRDEEPACACGPLLVSLPFLRKPSTSNRRSSVQP